MLKCFAAVSTFKRST